PARCPVPEPVEHAGRCSGSGDAVRPVCHAGGPGGGGSRRVRELHPVRHSWCLTSPHRKGYSTWCFPLVVTTRALLRKRVLVLLTLWQSRPHTRSRSSGP